MAAATQTRYDLVIPTTEQLKGHPYLPAPGILGLADLVIDKHSDVLGPLADFSVDYLWKARGGASHERPVFAGTKRCSGLEQYYGHHDFVIWFASDHLRDLKTPLTQEQYEALLFRELLKIGQQENTGGPLLKAYDVQAFHAEVERYGNWEAQLAKLWQVSHEAPQIALFDLSGEGELDEGDDEDDDWEDPPRNGRPHSEADAEAEAALRNRGRGATE